MAQRWTLVTGANGFVGSATLPLLLEQGLRVRAFSRRPFRLPDAPAARLELALGDIRDPVALDAAAEGVGTIVHLAVRKGDEDDSFDVNVGGARNLVAVARMHGIERIVNVSTQAATYAIRDRYGNSKAEADAVLAGSGLDVVTLIVSLIYGSELSGVFGKLVHFAERFPVVPVMGTGTAVFQPVHVDDVARAIVACVAREGPLRPVYNVGGPDALTFDEMLGMVLVASGHTKPTVHLPWLPLLWAARAMRAVMKAPPVTVSNVLGMARNNVEVLDLQPMTEELGVTPMAFTEGLRRTFTEARADRPSGGREGG